MTKTDLVFTNIALILTVLLSVWIGIHIGITQSADLGARGACEAMTVTLLDCAEITQN